MLYFIAFQNIFPTEIKNENFDPLSGAKKMIISEMWEDLFLGGEIGLIKEKIGKIENCDFKQLLQSILSFYAQNNPEKISMDLSGLPIVIYLKIKKYLDNKKLQQAAILLIRKREYFFNISKNFRDKITLLQIKMLRLLFENQFYHLVKEVALFNFSNADDLYYSNLKIVVGSLMLGCAKYDLAIVAFKNVYNNVNSTVREKSKACFFLGGIYEKKRNYQQSTIWFNLGKSFNQNFWSMMCLLKNKQKPKITEKKELNPIVRKSNLNDYFLDMALQNMQAGNFKLAIDFLYSLKRAYFSNFSPKLIHCIDKFALSPDPCCLLKIGVLMFKYTGCIVKECLPLPSVLLDLYSHGKINKRFLPLASAIIHEESKFYNASYYNLDNGYALGIMQVAPAEAKRACEKMKINYTRNLVIVNDKLNVLLAQECIKEFNKYTNNRMFFNLLYYNAGSMGNIFLRKFRFLDLDNPVFILLLLDVISSDRIRNYLEGVFEFYIISYSILMDEVLDFNFLCKNCL